MFCTNCGKEVSFNTKVCPFCDSEIMIEEQNEQIGEENIDLELNNEKTDEDVEKSTDKILSNNEKNITKITNGNLYEGSCKNFSCYNKYDIPLSTASFFFMQLVFLIPFINIFFLLIWAFKKNTNSNRKAYARSMLIWFLSISVILLFILIIMLFMRYPISIGFWFQEFKSFINNLPEI